MSRSAESALAHRNFVIYLAGNVFSVHGLWIHRVALGWFAWELTHSEFWVGVIAFSQFFPTVVLSPVFGVVADWFDRRVTAVIINLGVMFTTAALAWLTALERVDIALLAVFGFAHGSFSAAYAPVRLSLVPELVPRRVLPSALGMAAVVFNLAQFVGPGLGGVIIAFYGVAAAFAVNAATYLFFLIALGLIRMSSTPKRRVGRSIGGDLAVGFRYVTSHATIRQIFFLVLITSTLGRGVLELMPAFADLVFGRGSGALATLISATGGGAILAGLWLSRGLETKTLYAAVSVAAVSTGVLMFALGWASVFWLGVCIVTCLGFTSSIAAIGSQSLVQTLVDDELRGRVMGLWIVIGMGGASVGGLAGGALSRVIGLSTTAVAAGMTCALLTLAVSRQLLDRARSRMPSEEAHTSARESV